MHFTLTPDLKNWLTNNMHDEWRGIVAIVHQHPGHDHRQALLQVQLEQQLITLGPPV